MTNETIKVEIPIEYIEWVSVGLNGAEIFLNANTCPWDAASITVDIETALTTAWAIGKTWEIAK